MTDTVVDESSTHKSTVYEYAQIRCVLRLDRDHWHATCVCLASTFGECCSAGRVTCVVWRARGWRPGRGELGAARQLVLVVYIIIISLQYASRDRSTTGTHHLLRRSRYGHAPMEYESHELMLCMQTD